MVNLHVKSFVSKPTHHLGNFEWKSPIIVLQMVGLETFRITSTLLCRSFPVFFIIANFFLLQVQILSSAFDETSNFSHLSEYVKIIETFSNIDDGILYFYR